MPRPDLPEKSLRQGNKKTCTDGTANGNHRQVTPFNSRRKPGASVVLVSEPIQNAIHLKNEARL